MEKESREIPSTRGLEDRGGHVAGNRTLSPIPKRSWVLEAGSSPEILDKRLAANILISDLWALNREPRHAVSDF